MYTWLSVSFRPISALSSPHASDPEVSEPPSHLPLSLQQAFELFGRESVQTASVTSTLATCSLKILLTSLQTRTWDKTQLLASREARRAYNLDSGCNLSTSKTQLYPEQNTTSPLTFSYSREPLLQEMRTNPTEITGVLWGG